MKSKLKAALNKAWKFSKGNKTIFCLALLNMLDYGLIPLTGGWYLLVKGTLLALGGYSIFDHIKEGHFSQKHLTSK